MNLDLGAETGNANVNVALYKEYALGLDQEKCAETYIEGYFCKGMNESFFKE